MFTLLQYIKFKIFKFNRINTIKEREKEREGEREEKRKKEITVLSPNFITPMLHERKKI